MFSALLSILFARNFATRALAASSFLVLPFASAEKVPQVDASTLTGKVMCGYQGWFNTPGDGMNLGWTHWSRNRNKPFGPDNVTIDLWPDVSEFGPKERFTTNFRRADGSAAQVFSSATPATAFRHFDWMREYGLDGVFLQRFANGIGNKHLMRHKDRVLKNVRQGARRSGRVYALMYDLSGLPKGAVKRVGDDWKMLRRGSKMTDDPGYLHHQGKPVVAIWGVGFNDKRPYTLEECRELIALLKKDGCTVMLGIPTGWRRQHRDATDDPKLHEVLKMADILSPWTIGRYRSPKEVERHTERVWNPDLAWCKEAKLDYLPVVYPGFSWKNLHGGKLNQIPRLKGQFLWSQFLGCKKAGANMIYVAMFDEVDEATAIFKCTNDPPVGAFLTMEGLPSDHYLWLTGQGARLLRGEIPASSDLPKRK